MTTSSIHSLGWTRQLVASPCEDSTCAITHSTSTRQRACASALAKYARRKRLTRSCGASCGRRNCFDRGTRESVEFIRSRIRCVLSRPTTHDAREVYELSLVRQPDDARFTAQADAVECPIVRSTMCEMNEVPRGRARV